MRLLDVIIIGGVASIVFGHASCALEAAVRDHKGSPTLFVNGEPTAPMVFYGAARGAVPEPVTLGLEWQQLTYTFVAPEDNEGNAGVQFRVGAGPPGTVWLDDVRLYPSEPQDDPPENMLRFGDWEGTKEEMEATWVLFQRQDQGVDAEWDVDRGAKVSGEQSCKITIRGGGKSLMHIHFFQTGMTVKEGQRYTYSLWAKSDEERKVDFYALHQGPPWTIYNPEGDSPYDSQVKLAAAAGVHVHSFGIPMPWPRPGEEADFAGVDAALERTLRNDPEGLLLPRFGCNPPGWWQEEHPDEMMVFSDGKKHSMCMASEPWRQECLERLRALVRHCEDKYGDHMLGYHPCGQHTGEWFYQRSWEAVLSDFSPAMSAGFRRRAQAKYRTDEALRAAWGDPQITLDQVAVPTAEEQTETTLGFFRDPRRERKVIDYFEYKQLAMEEPLEMMARVIKEETGGKKLVTLFYGYTFDMHGIPHGPQTSGHLAMAKLLQCPDVDILTSPISYLDRQLGGAGMFMCAVDSVRDAGKLWLNEDDTRTYLTPEDSGFGRVDTPQGTFWVHQRNFGQLLPRRLACWYMDLGGIGWLNGKDIWDNIAPLRALYERTIDRPARWAPEVVAIVDETSPDYTKCTRDLHSPLVYQMRSQLFRLGCPFRIHLLSDLVAGRVPPAKAYIFLNCFHLDADARAAVAQATEGKTAVWFYGAGFLSNTASTENMSEVVGLPLQPGDPQQGRVTPEAGEVAVAEIEQPFGTDAQLDPLWTIGEAPGLRALGRYGDGSVAAAVRATEHGPRAYIGALHAPARMLRRLLQESGVHLYMDSDDVVLTDGEFLAVVATAAGPKTLRFTDRVRVLEALDGQPVADGVTTLELDLQLGETRLLRLEPVQ